MNYENLYYKNNNGKIEYNKNCLNCPYECKQSFRSTIMICKKTKELKNKRRK